MLSDSKWGREVEYGRYVPDSRLFGIRPTATRAGMQKKSRLMYRNTGVEQENKSVPSSEYLRFKSPLALLF